MPLLCFVFLRLSVTGARCSVILPQQMPNKYHTYAILHSFLIVDRTPTMVLFRILFDDRAILL